MVRLIVTSSMVAAFDALRSEGHTSKELEKEIGMPIEHQEIINLAERLKGNSRYSLPQLLRGSQVYTESPIPRTSSKTPEYHELMARLRREEEERLYERMITRDPARRAAQQQPALFSPTQADLDPSEEFSYSDVNRQLALIINVLISIVACSICIWIAARQWSTPSRIGLSMGGSGVVGLAEVIVYMGYMRRVAEAKITEGRKIERKTIMDTWLVGGKSTEKTIAQNTGQHNAAYKPEGNETIRQRHSRTT